MAHSDAFDRLRLQTIQTVSVSEVVVLGVRLFNDPNAPPLINFMRVVAILYGVFALVAVDERTAQRHGVAMTFVAKLFTLLRTVFAPEEEQLVTLVSFGAHRILPALAAIFGGVRTSAFFTLWAVVETAAVGVYRRVRKEGGPFSWWNVTTWYIAPSDHNVIGIEIFYIIVAAALAIALQHSCRQALTQLADALEARQRFITNMNHEIRTPLVGVLGMADILLLQKDLPLTTVDHLRIIHESGNALLAIVNNILDLSKLNASMMHADRRLVDVRAAVNTIANTFRALAFSKKLGYHILVDPKMPTHVMTDDTRLQQILGNLIGNAFKFTKTGGVWVSAGYAPKGIADIESLLLPQEFELHDANGDAVVPHDTVTAATMPTFRPSSRGVQTQVLLRGPAAFRVGVWARDWLQRFSTRPPHTVTHAHGATDHTPLLWIKVTDTGIGMTPAQLAIVIEPFQQADNTTTRSYGGSGLGLSICHDLADLLGGVMVYGSRPGKGSIFVVGVPCPTTASAPPRSTVADDDVTVPAIQSPEFRRADNRNDHSQQQQQQQQQHRPVVLVTDDNPLNVKVLRKQLYHLGCDTLVATNGQDCVAMVEKYLLSKGAKNPSDSGAAAPSQAALDHGDPPHRIDAVFMDLHMPVMDGIAAARAIRAVERRLHASPIAIVTVSAEDPETQRSQCHDSGMDEFLRKPVILDDLRAVLARLGLK